MPSLFAAFSTWFAMNLFHGGSFVLIANVGEMFFGTKDQYKLTKSIHPYILTVALCISLFLMLLSFLDTVRLDGHLTILEGIYFSSIFTSGGFISQVISPQVESDLPVIPVIILYVFGNLGVLLALILPGSWIGGGSGFNLVKITMQFGGTFLLGVGSLMIVTNMVPLAERTPDEVSVVIMGSGLALGTATLFIHELKVALSTITILLLAGSSLALTGYLTHVLTLPEA